jgi:ABC-type Zn uptake system ZnuABC Zn-binding protein ZnuA
MSRSMSAARLFLLIAAITLTAAACGSATPSPPISRLNVVASTTVFADLVSQVAGSAAEVSSLVPKGADVHTFDPKPSDIERLAGARLVVMNGLGLDDWLTRYVSASGAADATVLRLGEKLPGVAYLRGEDGATNPHLWMDVANAHRYVDRIRDSLSALDPANATTFAANAARYDAQLDALDTAIRAELATIPAEQRKIIAFHDAFPYFAAAYGLEVVGTVVASPGQDPSAANMARLIDVIRNQHVRAIFTEAQFSPKLVQQIGDDTGATVEGNLYDDTLGDPPVDSYLGMLRWDADRVVAALRE